MRANPRAGPSRPRARRPHRSASALLVIVLAPGAVALSTCTGTSALMVVPMDAQQVLIERGRRIFFEETFAGNGRTCGTCHPAENNFTIDPAFIATLPPDDPLFVAEFVPELREHFEKPELMRKSGLILENLDGFDDLENRFVLRGVPHVLAQRISVDSAGGPRTGWSGDGAPGDGSLRSFATGAVIQHFTRSLRRVAGEDFRLPTDDELDALEAFLLSLGRQRELMLPLPLLGDVPRWGQELFLDDTRGKCNLCHANAGANAAFGDVALGNASFDTGVEDLPDMPPTSLLVRIPDDDGFGIPGDRTFNTPPLVEAADTGPFFHNNSVATLEGAVAFYNGAAFNGSPSGRRLAELDPEGTGIRLDANEVVAVAAFLRVLNALENIREGGRLLRATLQESPRRPLAVLLREAAAEIEDAAQVLEGAGLHPGAAVLLRRALDLARSAPPPGERIARMRAALDDLARARAQLIHTP